MADRFWVGDGGNWSDNTNHWSASSGGAPNASKPTSSDSVYFDANSFTTGSQTVTIDETAYCLDMDWTGATNTPELAGSLAINVYGDATFIADMVCSHTGRLAMFGNGVTITTNGIVITSQITTNGSCTQADDLITTHAYFSVNGSKTWTTGNFNLTTKAIEFAQSSGHTFNIGTSIITCTDFIIRAGATLTVTTAASTLIVTGTGVFDGGGQTYNNVELNGTAHTISGDNTFDKLKLAAGSVITITPGSTQTIRKLITPSTATNVTTIQTGGASATIQGHRGYCELNHVDLTSIVAGEKYRYYAGDNSTDGGGNTNWIFTRKVRPWGRFW